MQLCKLSFVSIAQEFLKLITLVGICTCKDAVIEWICVVSAFLVKISSMSSRYLHGYTSLESALSLHCCGCGDFAVLSLFALSSSYLPACFCSCWCFGVQWELDQRSAPVGYKTCFVVAYFQLVEKRGWVGDKVVAAVLAGVHIYFGIKW